MWIKEMFFKYATAILLIVTIIFVLYNTGPVFYPILWFVAAILLPILFATLLYYIVRPLVRLLGRWVPRHLAILVVYAFIAIISFVVILVIVPDIATTVSDISPEKIASIKDSSNHLFEKLKSYIPFSNLLMIENLLVSYAPKVNSMIYHAIVNLISTAADIAIALSLTPIVLYYFLRDDDLFTGFVIRFIPDKFQTEVQKILHDVDVTLSGFILTQMMVALVIGSLLCIGYVFIGLPNAFSLALFAMIFYVIPFFGTFIAIIPALIVGATISWVMILKVVAVMILAHFCESNLLTPRLMSQRLKIHPLTIILLLLAAGTLYGIMGMLLVTPAYAILKVIVWNLYKIFKLHYEVAKKQKTNDPRNGSSR
jgi:predicted PurR-regulated permease PerM